MAILVSPHSEQEEKIFRAFLDSLEFEYSEEEDIYIPATSDAKRQTLEEYNREIDDAVAEIEAGNYVTMDELKDQMKSW